jgi:hypothetical protein
VTIIKNKINDIADAYPNPLFEPVLYLKARPVELHHGSEPGMVSATWR